MVIITAGMIGCGKSSLAKLLAEAFDSEVFYESVEDNPILPLFYTASDEEIQTKRYPFLLQLHFLNTRFKSIKQALIHENNVLDRSIYEDAYFAKVNHELGRISDLEFSLYESLLNNMMEELNELPKKSPDLLIYLHGSFEKVLERIQQRGREYELDEDLRAYYYQLWQGYDEWIKNHYNASEVFKIDIDTFDYVNNPTHAKELIQAIRQKLMDIRGEEPFEIKCKMCGSTHCSIEPVYEYNWHDELIPDGFETLCHVCSNNQRW